MALFIWDLQNDLTITNFDPLVDLIIIDNEGVVPASGLEVAESSGD